MPVRLIYGEDTYSISKRVEQLIKDVTTQEWEIFNYIQVDCKTAAIPQIITEVMTIPLGREERLSILQTGQYSINARMK
ncbi:hypothetical protein QUB80_22745 [Chlorogloeopsis sp. ULAP01]|nr:hypothetical protein [Chlorogloeopsis sp. ULAP01]MDM9383509.1 hypothetical protein [Chlorogloeopsis sp. ULAP01]